MAADFGVTRDTLLARWDRAEDKAEKRGLILDDVIKTAVSEARHYMRHSRKDGSVADWSAIASVQGEDLVNIRSAVHNLAWAIVNQGSDSGAFSDEVRGIQKDAQNVCMRIGRGLGTEEDVPAGRVRGGTGVAVSTEGRPLSSTAAGRGLFLR